MDHALPHSLKPNSAPTGKLEHAAELSHGTSYFVQASPFEASAPMTTRFGVPRSSGNLNPPQKASSFGTEARSGGQWEGEQTAYFAKIRVGGFQLKCLNNAFHRFSDRSILQQELALRI